MNNSKKLTLDNVLLKLQQDHSMSTVTEMEKITGGTSEVLDECHIQIGPGTI